MRRRALLRELAGKLGLPGAERMIRSFDIVGDIAVLRVPEEFEAWRFDLAEALLKELRGVNVVLRQVGPTSGEYRIRDLEWLAGEKRTITLHREHGCLFRVDLATSYFSPRLSYERARIASLVGDGEVVVNMFAGVGCYSILIAKRHPKCTVYSIDINPDAIRLHEENVLLNRVQDRVIVIEGDARRVIEARLTGVADRVLMPLPQRAIEFVDAAVKALRERRGWIHYYDFVHAAKGENPIEKAWLRVDERLRSLGVSPSRAGARVVRSTGPNWYQVALDLRIVK